jgi:hypothetical protein
LPALCDHPYSAAASTLRAGWWPSPGGSGDVHTSQQLVEITLLLPPARHPACRLAAIAASAPPALA